MITKTINMNKMKLLFTLAIGLLMMQSVTAQSENDGRIFKKFKVDVSVGYAAPSTSTGSGKKGGALFVIEPKYNVMDQVAVGLRMEGAAMVRVANGGDEGDVKVNYSYIATGDYYFSNNKFRPFGGIGAGIYTFANVHVSDDEDVDVDNIPRTSKFGFMARAGFEYGHLRLGAEYNFLPEKSGYFGIKIGAVIGGGRK